MICPKTTRRPRLRFPPELAAFLNWDDIDEQATREGEAILRAFRSRLWRTVFEETSQDEGRERGLTP